MNVTENAGLVYFGRYSSFWIPNEKCGVVIPLTSVLIRLNDVLVKVANFDTKVNRSKKLQERIYFKSAIVVNDSV